MVGMKDYLVNDNGVIVHLTKKVKNGWVLIYENEDNRYWNVMRYQFKAGIGWTKNHLLKLRNGEL